MSKLIELERDKFLDEVKSNWSKWKNPTTLKELYTYMIEKSFTKRAEGTLKGLSKDKLRDIILNGDTEDKEEKKAPTPTNVNFGTEAVDFLEDVKHDIHKEKFNPFVKKMIIKQIDKYSSKIEDNSILEKMGYIGLVIAFILLVLEMVFKYGYKDLRKKIKEFKEKKAKAPGQNNDTRE